MFLSNDWMIWFYKNYSMLILMAPTILLGALKVLAILKPSVKNDKIRELVQEWFLMTGKGGKK